MSMGSLLGALGIGLAVVLTASKQENLSALAKTSVLRYHAARKKIASGGGIVRTAKLSREKRRAIARLGGLSKARKARLRKAERERAAKRKATT